MSDQNIVFVDKDLGTIGDGDPNPTEIDLEIEDLAPDLIPIAAAVFPLTSGSPALGGATGIKINAYANNSASAATPCGETSDVTSAAVWKIDTCPARRLIATWVGTPDASSKLGLSATIVCRRAGDYSI